MPRACDGSGALLWSTFLGAGGYDLGRALALDHAGNVFITGQTTSHDFPATPGAWDTSYNGGICDVFVSALSADGDSLLWTTFLGGSGEDYGTAIALDASGYLVITGFTNSPDFPATPAAYDTSFSGGIRDVFVARLSPTGDALVWSTFLGGNKRDECYVVALDPSGNVTLTGWTTSPDFPATSGAYDTSYNGGFHDGDAFVTRLSASGSGLLWSSFLGGATDDYGYALALDSARNPVLAGVTDGPTFPTTTGSYDRTYNGGYEAFVAKLSSAGNALLWSTFLGSGFNDFGLSLALDASRNVVVGGYTASPTFPVTTGASQSTYGGGAYDSFVAKISFSGNALLWSSFLGGSDDDRIQALALDGWGHLVVSGYTESPDFPTTASAIDTSFNGGTSDGFVASLQSDGSALVESGFLGGGDDDRAYGVALDASSDVVVMGQTQSTDFPASADAYDPSENGLDDVFAAKLVIPLATSVPSPGTRNMSSPADSGGLRLENPAPSPAAAPMHIAFVLPRPGVAHLAIYDTLGRSVRRLWPRESATGELAAGRHVMTWDGRDDNHVPLAPGIYFARLDWNGETIGRKLLLTARR